MLGLPMSALRWLGRVGVGLVAAVAGIVGFATATVISVRLFGGL
jgi:hypothetical protein